MYALLRTVQYFLVLFFIFTLTFFLFRIAPGDPTTALLFGDFSPELMETLEQQFGLDEPLYMQYYLYVINFLQGDFGVSFYYHQPVTEVIWGRLYNSALIYVPSLILVTVIAFFFGGRMGWKPDSKREITTSYLFISFRSIPHFVLGLFLLTGFSYWLGIFPPGGIGDVLGEEGSIWNIQYFLLPILTLVLAYLAEPYLLLRNNLMRQAREEYVEYYEVQGIDDNKIRKFAIKNSILPFMTYLPVLILISTGGLILVETVFSWPGIGRELIDSVHRRDYPVAQAAFFLITAIVITGNYMIDLLYAYLDPRIEMGASK